MDSPSELEINGECGVHHGDEIIEGTTRTMVPDVLKKCMIALEHGSFTLNHPD